MPFFCIKKAIYYVFMNIDRRRVKKGKVSMIRKLSIPILTLVILWTIILCIEKQVIAACFLWIIYSALQFFRRE
ncbi:hypothetical protein COE55_10240 [Priestia megaterium]|nr:hypothetical protein COE55_10240 [Priestia megaterium]